MTIKNRVRFARNSPIGAITKHQRVYIYVQDFRAVDGHRNSYVLCHGTNYQFLVDIVSL